MRAEERAEMLGVLDMTERTQMLMLQIVGGLVAFGVVACSAILSTRYPMPATLVSSIVTGLLAKLLAAPLPQVTVQQAGRLRPPLAAAAALRAIDSLPPEHRSELKQAEVVLTGLSYPPKPKPPPIRGAS